MLSTGEIKAKKGQASLSMITCYDYPTGIILSRTEIDMVLVGDSLGEVIYGFPNTSYVTMEMICRHTEAVKRGLKEAKHLVVDMPFHSYETPKKALSHARQLIRAGANSLKLEIPSDDVLHALREEGMQIMGHVGLTPQTIHVYRKQGREEKEAKRIIRDALRLERAGCYAVIAEAVVSDVTERISHELKIPVIGIASGERCDGQILVLYDLVGYYAENRPYVKKEMDIFDEMVQAVNRFCRRVNNNFTEQRPRSGDV